MKTDVSISELKKMINSKEQKSIVTAVCVILLVVLVIATVVIAVIKIRERDCDCDCDCDENGCYYSDEDFEDEDE